MIIAILITAVLQAPNSYQKEILKFSIPWEFRKRETHKKGNPTIVTEHTNTRIFGRQTGANWTLPTSHVKLNELFKFSGSRPLADLTAVEEDHLSKWR